MFAHVGGYATTTPVTLRFKELKPVVDRKSQLYWVAGPLLYLAYLSCPQVRFLQEPRHYVALDIRRGIVIRVKHGLPRSVLAGRPLHGSSE